MELKWLEDFVLLAQVKNFSKAAELHNITQSAFSRRIQSLELWLGVALIDRACFPTELTPAGHYFYEQAVILIEDISRVRSILKNGNSGSNLTIEFAIPHNLSLTFFPEWIKIVSKYLGTASFKLRAFNVHDAVMNLAGGAADLLIAYTHPSSPLKLDPMLYESKLLGIEHMSLYRLADDKGAMLDFLGSEIRFLAYGSSSYLGKIADHILEKSDRQIHLKKTYETDMAEGLKLMMLAGHGVAFLPESSVKKELNDGSVVKVFSSIDSGFDAELEIRLFRERQPPSCKENKAAHISRNSLELKKGAIQNLWSNLPSSL